MTAAQSSAADPAASAWVSASAGTGKTHVLTNRVLRLLLAGAAPERILCLTYTKAAAAEMANRIQARLADWAVAPDARLFDALARLTGEPPEVETMVAARRLFARVLEAPGGLRIQTIHSFCQSLLGRFPVEVGLAPRFTALDEAGAAELLAEATAEVLRAADPALKASVERLSSIASDETFDAMVSGFVGGRTRLPEDLGPATLPRYLGDLALALGRGPEDVGGGAAVYDAFAARRRASPAALRDVAAALAQGTMTDAKAAAALAAFVAGGDFDSYVAIFLTDKGLPRKNPMTVKLAARFPREAAWMADEADLLAKLRIEATTADVHAASAALLTLGAAILGRYAEAKARRRAVDYDDMVLKARDLLTKGAAAAWVLYKLDGGIDHLLIDEAQDTSPAQWELVRALTEEFFAGQSAGERHRTVFAVGDVKQSIYSFQGAAPAVFGEERRRVALAAAAAGKQFRPVELDLSFRSVPLVLGLVDAVFAQDPAKPGVVEDGVLAHAAHRKGGAGLIELWPVEEGETAEEGEAWAAMRSAARGRSAQTALAERIAGETAAWLGRRDILPSRGRPIRPGDIMVLVRRRTPFVDALTRACKARGVPVAGSDRMALADQLGVKDLMAVGRFALLPDDDLTLACVLKGPFVGLAEGALLELAASRAENWSLWRALRARAGERADFAAAHGFLAEVLERADYVAPYDFFARLLDRHGGRRRLLGRLGPQAAEPVEEFLSLALRHESDHAPSLQGFLQAVATGEIELKRDLDRGRDELRILTVHAAKGLQAPIVLLPDTTGVPAPRESLFWTPGGLPVWAVAGAMALPAVADLRQTVAEAGLAEYRRLLYVALTRAEDRLIVCGWRAGRAEQAHQAGSWYDLVAAAFPAEATEAVLSDGTPVLRLASPQEAPVAEQEAAAEGAVAARALPDWAARPAPVERRPSDPLSPSRLADADLGVASPLALGGTARFLRGRLVHRLLELLPEVAAEARAGAAARFLALRGEDLGPDGQAALAAETLAVLADPAFAPVFGPGSRPEVPIAAVLGEETVLGQIDRLAVLEDRVLIVDFKTDRPSPADWRAVAPGYLRQLALYRAAVARLYPGRPVEAALLWTETPRLMPIPGAALDACLADLPGVSRPVDAPPGAT
ncbi:double-strand break repair helicase AddA [Zavarzinia sp.]|uniref:double-strand break repair helicase AddA n=1 Tax=Zavarzinia sp. TaxID=2027920 RepID=UPI003566D1DB